MISHSKAFTNMVSNNLARLNTFLKIFVLIVALYHHDLNSADCYVIDFLHTKLSLCLAQGCSPLLWIVLKVMECEV